MANLEYVLYEKYTSKMEGESIFIATMGVERDKVETKKWFTLAAQNGSDEAKDILNKYFS